MYLEHNTTMEYQIFFTGLAIGTILGAIIVIIANLPDKNDKNKPNASGGLA